MILILPGNHVANLFQRTGCHAIVGRTPANQATVISGDQGLGHQVRQVASVSSLLEL